MVKCSGHLNDSLQESFFRLWRGEPDLLPGFVGFEEMAGIKLRDAPLEFVLRALVLHQVDTRNRAIPFLSAHNRSKLSRLPTTVEIRIELPGVKLAVVEADSAGVAPADRSLAAEMDQVCERLRREFTVESVMELESIRAVRAMFRSWGLDPARYRPSSEALLRRVVQGKGLYRISNVVDAANLGSVETGWPYGSYNRTAILPPVSIRAGATGETYEGIGKHTWHLAERPVLADSGGAFGSPISDSTRTMVTETAHELVTVIYAPSSASEAALERAMSRLAERLARAAGATATRTAILA
jgi:DNA/RNA-binding domain of Phe-tRNA-synthetase-like protein